MNVLRSLVSVCLCLISVFGLTHAAEDLLSPEQRAYLDQLGPITMGVDPDWMPYERLDEEGNFSGIAADLITLVGERLGVTIELVPTADWDETLARSQAGDFHIIPFLNQTPTREVWLIFSDPIFIDPNVFITRE